MFSPHLDRMVNSMSQKIRNEPRISISKLGEYLTATPRRRRAIISDQKRPRDVVVIWYMEARRAAVECVLADGDLSVRRAAVDQLDDDLQHARTDTNDATRASASIDAIDAFAQLVLDDLDLGKDIEQGEAHAAKLSIGGVMVSVRPDIVVKTKKGVAPSSSTSTRATRSMTPPGATWHRWSTSSSRTSSGTSARLIVAPAWSWT